MRSRLGEWFWQWRLKLAGRPLTEAGCGRCAYPIRGLDGTRCPEGGAEQADVGVSHPMFPPVSGRTLHRLHLLQWTGMVVVLAILLNSWLLPLAPRGLSNHRDYELESGSGLLPALTVRQIGYGWGWLFAPWIPEEPRQVVVRRDDMARADGQVEGTYYAELTGNGGYGYVFRYRADGTSDKIFERRDRIDEQFVTDWLAAMEVDTSSPHAKPEITELVRLAEPRPFAEQLPVMRSLRVTSITGGPGIEAARGGQHWVVAWWLIVWLIGVVVLRIRYIRRVLPLTRTPVA